MTYDASDTRAIRRAAKAARQAEAERRVVLTNLMSLPTGRAYMYARLERCHVFHSSFSESHGRMAFAEGERNIGLQDLNDAMQFCPDQFIQMLREANDRSASADSNRPSRDNSDARGDDNGPALVDSEYDPSPDDPE